MLVGRAGLVFVVTRAVSVRKRGTSQHESSDGGGEE
jgi:hypothetical protein